MEAMQRARCAWVARPAWAWSAWPALAAALAGALLLAGCAGQAPDDLERKGYRSDNWYRERHERVVEGVYVRQRRMSYAEMQVMRMNAEFREAWIEHQRRRISARNRVSESRGARRDSYLQQQTGTLNLLEERRREEQATRARQLEQFRQAQAEKAAELEQQRREAEARRARNLKKFQEAAQAPDSQPPNGQPPNG